MARYDFRTPRLFVAADLAETARLALDASQANYLGNVLRLGDGDAVQVFNGRDGEWRATLESAGKRRLFLVLGERVRPQTAGSGIHYLFAPLKHARLDYMVQKAVEMGAARLQPVLTAHAQVSRINLERMQANAIEAAEQCGILTLPEIATPLDLDRTLAARDGARLLVFCDEDAEVKDPVAALAPQPVRRRSTCWSGRRAGSPTTSERPSWRSRTPSGWRSDLESCAPIPPRSPPWRWSAPSWATGGPPPDPPVRPR
jgi:16S rRNA (uracil1498-N3)-methyltransferase